MLFSLSTVDLLVPTQFDGPTLHESLAALQSDPRSAALQHALVNRTFAHLWTAPAVVQLLRDRCVLCGGHYGPHRLLTHLLTLHADDCAWATQIQFQVNPLLCHLQPNDFQCSLCTQIFNLPPTVDDSELKRSQLQSEHFSSNCPVAKQISLLLHPIHGERRAGSTRSGVDERTAGARAPSPRAAQMAGRKRRGPPQQTRPCLIASHGV